MFLKKRFESISEEEIYFWITKIQEKGIIEKTIRHLYNVINKSISISLSENFSDLSFLPIFFYKQSDLCQTKSKAKTRRVIVLIIKLDHILASRCFIKWLHSKARALMNPLVRRWGRGQRGGRDHPGQGERPGLQKAQQVSLFAVAVSMIRSVCM